jgi:predicted transcriptional regulator
MMLIGLFQYEHSVSSAIGPFVKRLAAGAEDVFRRCMASSAFVGKLVAEVKEGYFSRVVIRSTLTYLDGFGLTEAVPHYATPVSAEAFSAFVRERVKMVRDVYGAYRPMWNPLPQVAFVPKIIDKRLAPSEMSFIASVSGLLENKAFPRREPVISPDEAIVLGALRKGETPPDRRAGGIRTMAHKGLLMKVSEEEAYRLTTVGERAVQAIGEVPIPSPRTLLVMGILALFEEMHGYGIATQAGGELPYREVYKILRRMRDGKLIFVSREDSSVKRKFSTKYYRLTERGERIHRQWSEVFAATASQ